MRLTIRSFWRISLARIFGVIAGWTEKVQIPSDAVAGLPDQRLLA